VVSRLIICEVNSVVDCRLIQVKLVAAHFGLMEAFQIALYISALVAQHDFIIEREYP
jgi:hypothetical protein